MDLKQTLKTIKLYESTISMVLGAIVIALAAFLVFSYFRNLKVGKTTDSAVKNEIAQKEVYKVQKGDTLWSISESYYNDGFSWTKIADANSLTKSNEIEVGMELTIPEVNAANTQIILDETKDSPLQADKTVEVTTENVNNQITIKENSYTVTKGDSLWNIAVRAYGDGYKWPEIAKANKITNPDIIYSGMNLTLPNK